MKKERYRITEYGSFVREKEVQGYTSLPRETFDALENFLLNSRSRKTDALELMSLSARKGVGRIITARNYVGVITLEDGTAIEILPKIFSAEAEDASKTKKLLVRMLMTLRDSPFQSLQTTNVDMENGNLLEVFIRMFLEEAFFIVKRGLKCNYERTQQNERVFKGKLKVSEHIRFNYAHKDRCYVEYDEFHVNRVENRLLKSTLLYLYRRSASSGNRNDIRTLLYSFSEVEESTDYKGDFARIIPERNTKDYERALLWSRVFLAGKSFTSFAGSQAAIALLFPMDALFESYVTALMRRLLRDTRYRLSAQERKYHLFEEPGKRFLLRPDLVIRDPREGRVFLLDTKWKLLSETRANYGISQADMYQMYAYQKKYGAESVTLIYPMTESVEDKKIRFQSGDGVTVKVCFVDLYRPKESLEKVIECCMDK